ncbi:MAG: hypothetical protein JSS55_17340 [Proteobacteria bacterium]|nr:hypothetical protein [Pseudomonadota bacterium]
MNGGTETALALVEMAPPKRILIEKIEGLNISADAKAVLCDITAIAIDVGGRLIQVGRRIIAFILDLVRSYPNTTFGLVAALVVSALIASVPIMGAVLAPLLTPLLVAFGVAKGALVDLAHTPLARRVRELEDQFANLAPRG